MKNYLLGFLLLLAISVTVTSQYEYYAHHTAANTQSGSGTAITGSDAPKTTTDAEQAERNHPCWYVAFLIFGWPGGITVWALILTLAFIADQSRHTARAATATEESVKANAETSKKQLRAYLSVMIGGAVPQDAGLRFECRPTLINTGQTPAKSIRHLVKADILPSPLPREFVLSEDGELTGDGTLGNNKDAFMAAVVPHRSHQDDVHGIRYGIGNSGLYVWGIVYYKDIFGDEHYTRFCQRIFWTAADEGETEQVRGQYVPGRNEGT